MKTRSPRGRRWRQRAGALTLAQFAAKTIVVNRAPELTGQARYRQLIAENSRIEVRNDATIAEILGNGTVSAARSVSGGGACRRRNRGRRVGYFALRLDSEPLDGALALGADGAIPTNGAMRTSLKAICAAGMVRVGAVGRAAASAGDGSVAALSIDRYLKDGAWPT